MIDEGDGSFQRKLDNGQCPRCRSAIVMRRETDTLCEYSCSVCSMKIIDVKGKDDE